MGIGEIGPTISAQEAEQRINAIKKMTAEAVAGGKYACLKLLEDAGIIPKKKVTLSWDGDPTIVLEDGMILPRAAELIIHKDYYPRWPEERWPRHPATGEKLEMATPEKINK